MPSPQLFCAAFIVVLQRNSLESDCLPSSFFFPLFPVGSSLGPGPFIGNVAVLHLKKLDESFNPWAVTLGNMTEQPWQLCDGQRALTLEWCKLCLSESAWGSKRFVEEFK